MVESRPPIDSASASTNAVAQPKLPPPLADETKRPVVRLAHKNSHLDETKQAVILASRKTDFKVDSVGYPRWHNIVAGAAAGAGARLLTAPLDLLRIRRQLSSMPSTAASPVAAASSSATNGGKGSLLSSLSHIVRTEGGVKSLFRGNVAATYLWVTYAAVQFSIYARASDVLNGFAPCPPRGCVEGTPRWATRAPAPLLTAFEAIASSPTGVAFAAGATAGAGATLCTYPFDITRTAFASRGLLSSAAAGAAASPPKTVLEFAKKMYRTSGVRGFYSGCGPAVVQIIPYMGLNFAMYDYITRLSDKHPVGSSGVAGAISGGVSKCLVYPMDTVKKRLQAQGFVGIIAPASGADPNKYKNMVHCIQTMAREEGVSAFYRGLVPTVMKSMAATGLTFAFFTMSKNTLEGIHDTIMAGEVQ